MAKRSETQKTETHLSHPHAITSTTQVHEGSRQQPSIENTHSVGITARFLKRVRHRHSHTRQLLLG